MNRGKLILVRHGESMGNVWKSAYRDDRTNFLSDLGTKQAEILGIYLKRSKFEFNLIVSSDLTRARQTTALALINMQDWQRHYEVFPELNECRGSDSLKYREIYELDKLRVFTGMDKLMNMWINGDALCITHYHTMQNIFDYLQVPRVSIESNEGRHVPNAIPFVYDWNDPTKIMKLDPSDHGPQH